MYTITVCNIDATPITSGFTNGAGQIWLTNLRCLGNEYRLGDCRASGVGVHSCLHVEDAGVRCLGNASTCREGDIRLQDGYNQGRIEICYNNLWGTVCDDSWGNVDAQVACKQLGFTIIGE